MDDTFAASKDNSEKLKVASRAHITGLVQPQNGVRFNLDETVLQRDSTTNAPVKSIGISKESKGGSSSRGLITGSVRLFSKNTPRNNEALCTKGNDDNSIQTKHISRYVDGNFVAGKVVDLAVDRCYVMAFEPTEFDQIGDNNSMCTNIMPLLAVGTLNAIVFYETTLYSLVREVPRNGMVSAIKWITTKYHKSNVGTRHILLAVSDLNGMVSLYSIDTSILECQGPTLIHEFLVSDQVRAMDCCLYNNHDDSTLLMIVGDKSGNVTFSSLRLLESNITNEVSIQHIDTVLERDYKSAVLGIAICTIKNLLAISTKDGKVLVYTLHQHMNGPVQSKELVWETTRSGPVRCIIFSSDGSQMGFGGYDKNVVFVETAFWTSSRQLNMSGTVSCNKHF
jgi:hypothetical protein